MPVLLFAFAVSLLSGIVFGIAPAWMSVRADPVLRGACVLIAVGLMTGLPLTFAAGRFLGSHLYGIDPYNPMLVLISITMLAPSALVASLIPALRSSLIAPVDALRRE